MSPDAGSDTVRGDRKYEGFFRIAGKCKKDGCTDLNKQKRKWRFGDRRDGRLMRTLDPMMKLMPYVMPTRNDACNMFRGQADAENIDKYVQEKRQNGMPGFTQMHCRSPVGFSPRYWPKRLEPK